MISPHSKHIACGTIASTVFSMISPSNRIQKPAFGVGAIRNIFTPYAASFNTDSIVTQHLNTSIATPEIS
jgi:hypothetical protein